MHLGVRPPARQRRRQVAGPAAQVHHQAGMLRLNPGGELEEWSRPLVAEAQVLTRIPHDRPLTPDWPQPLHIYLDIKITDRHSSSSKVSMSRDMLHGMAPSQSGGKPLRDEVDDLVAQWRGERPDLDVSPLQVLSRLSRLARHLDRARRAAFAAHGLDPWGFDVLSALRRQGPPYQLSPRALLHATLVTSGTMTNRIDRLATAGLVSRRRDEQDKRGVQVALTDVGKQKVDAALDDLLDSERTLLTGLTGAQQDELATLLRVLLAPFDAPGGPRLDSEDEKDTDFPR